MDSRNEFNKSAAFFAESTLALPLLLGVELSSPAGFGVGFEADLAWLEGVCRADLDLNRAKTMDVTG